MHNELAKLETALKGFGFSVKRNDKDQKNHQILIAIGDITVSVIVNELSWYRLEIGAWNKTNWLRLNRYDNIVRVNDVQEALDVISEIKLGKYLPNIEHN